MKLERLVAFLDRELKLTEFDDSSNNGLQVANSGAVKHVCCGVDASMEFFRAARDRGADMVLCHHGLSWGDSLKTITGLNYERLSFLIQNDISLYAAHLPLDAHPTLGNNALICRALGLRSIKPFGEYRGKLIGFQGLLPKATRYTSFKKRAASVFGREPQTMDFGKRTVRSVAVVSGGAASEIDEAGRKGIDVYVSGEPTLVAYSLAQEYGVNAVFGGHYATEVFGVRALAELIRKQFRIKAEFVTFDVPF